MPSGRGRRVAVGVATSAVLTLSVSACLFWRSLAVEYHLWQFRSRPGYFLETLQAPGKGPRSEALREHLHTADGKHALFLVFAEEVLGQWGEAGVALDRITKQKPQQRSLEDFSSALLWIGPKTAGFQPAGENVAVHVLLKRSPTDHGSAVGSSCIVVRDDRLRRSKAILAAVEVLRGSKFVHSEAPAFHFEFLAGDRAVAAFGLALWDEQPPEGNQTVCFASRSGLKHSSGGYRETLRKSQTE